MTPFPSAGRGVYGDVSADDWADWRWQLRHQIRTPEQLARVVALTDDEREAAPASLRSFRLGITPYYAALLDPNDPDCPIRAQAVPRTAELRAWSHQLVDPLAEDRDMPVPGLTHRYPDRVLLYTNHACAVYCRHCTRRRKVSDPSSSPDAEDFVQALAYLREHTEVRDVVLSGGDPLSLSDERLERLIRALRDIPHIEIVRIGTRHPVTLPFRITDALCTMLRRYPPVYVHVHFNHPRECTAEAAEACARLADAGCVLGNQMVLLRGVNDRPETVLALNRALLRMRVRPYYIYACDLAEGVEHFRTPLAVGLDILDALRGFTSGMAVPHLVVDLPGGGGKVTVQRSPIVRREGASFVLENRDGLEYGWVDAG